MKNILYQSDDNYAPYMGVSMLSLFKNNADVKDIKVYIIDDGISEDNKIRLNKVADDYERAIEFIDVSKILDNPRFAKIFSYTGFRKNKHSYLKMAIDELLPEVHGRMLYIDCDTVIEGNLEPLFSLDMRGKVIGMVQDSMIGNSKESIGLKRTDNYYNSGVILFDLDLWSEKKCFDRVINHLVNIRTYGTVDQDVLNMEFKEEIVTLPLCYNCQLVHYLAKAGTYTKVVKHGQKFYAQDEIVKATENPAIVHFLRFIGEHPWDLDSIHPGTSFYNKYCSISPWKDHKRIKQKKSFVFGVEQVMYKIFPAGLFLRIFYLVHENMIKKSNRK